LGTFANLRKVERGGYLIELRWFSNASVKQTFEKIRIAQTDRAAEGGTGASVQRQKRSCTKRTIKNGKRAAASGLKQLTLHGT